MNTGAGTGPRGVRRAAHAARTLTVLGLQRRLALSAHVHSTHDLGAHRQGTGRGRRSSHGVSIVRGTTAVSTASGGRWPWRPGCGSVTCVPFLLLDSGPGGSYGDDAQHLRIRLSVLQKLRDILPVRSARVRSTRLQRRTTMPKPGSILWTSLQRSWRSWRPPSHLPEPRVRRTGPRTRW